MWARVQHLTAALVAVAMMLGSGEAAGEDERLVRAIALTDRVVELYGLAKYDEAIAVAREVVRLREAALGSDHPDVAASLGSVARLLSAKGNFAEAEPLLRRALAIREKVFGPCHPNVAMSLNNLAELVRERGEYAAAEPMYRRAIAIWEKVVGPDDRDLATGLNNLALLLAAKGNFAEAELLFRRALWMSETTLSPDHPDLATSLNNLADMLRAKGDYAASEPLCRRALAITEKAFGPSHPYVALKLNVLAQLLRDKGDYAGAEKLCRRALMIQEKSLAPDHPDLAASLNNLALLLSARADYSAAEPLYRRAMAIYEKVFGPDHAALATCLDNLAELLRAKGDYAAAERLYRRDLAIREKALGPDHPDVATSKNNLALLLTSMGDYAGADPLFRSALAIVEKSRGGGHPASAMILSNLAYLLSKVGDYAAAEAPCQLALAIREKALGPDHPDVAMSLNNLAELRRAAGNYSAAEPLYRRALAIWEMAFGPAHPEVAKVLNNLTFLRLARGDESEAFRLHSRALTIEDKQLTAMLAVGSQAEKAALMKTLSPSTNSAVGLHLQFAPGNQEAARLALETLLRRKGRLIDAMIDGMAALRRRLGPADRRALADLADASRALKELYHRGPDPRAPDRFRADVAKATDALSTAEGEAANRSADLRAAVQPLTIERVAALIPQDAALLELTVYQPFDSKGTAAARWGEPRYAAYVLRPSGAIAYQDLGPTAAIDALVTKVRVALSSPRLDAKDAVRVLSAAVWQPIRLLIPNVRHVLLGADGALSLVPFGALVEANGKFVLETTELTYLTSGRDLVRLAVGAKPRERALVVADPAFGPCQAGTLCFGPLAGARAEGEATAKLLTGARLLTGESANEAAVTSALAPVALHLATHGFFLDDLAYKTEVAGRSAIAMTGEAKQLPPLIRDDENPLLRSGLALAGANAATGTGKLTALDVTNLDLSGTMLVVLSACETGVGRATAGDGVYGLRRAFVLAGAQTLVMSLWAVDDEATRVLMTGYYARLMRGEGRVDALRAEQLAMLHTERWRHPAYWAAFMAMGAEGPMDWNLESKP